MDDTDLDAKFFTAVTGIASEDVDRFAERIANMQRVILLREGWKVLKPTSSEYNFTELMLRHTYHLASCSFQLKQEASSLPEKTVNHLLELLYHKEKSLLIYLHEQLVLKDYAVI